VGGACKITTITRRSSAVEKDVKLIDDIDFLRRARACERFIAPDGAEMARDLVLDMDKAEAVAIIEALRNAQSRLSGLADGCEHTAALVADAIGQF